MANTIITPAIFSNEVIRNLDRDTVFMKHTNREYEGELKKSGDTVRVQTLPTLTFTASSIAGAGDLVNADVGVGPGGSIVASDFVITIENLVIDQYSEKMVKLPNIQEVQSNLSLEESVAKRFAEGIGTLMDDSVVNQILVTQVANIPAANKIDSASPTAATSANIYGRVIALRTALRKNNVKVKNMRLFVSTDIEGLLLQAPQFTTGSNDALDIVKTGFIGMIGGVPVFVSTALDASKEMIMMAEGAVNCVVQVNDTKVMEGTDGFYTNVLAMVIWGMKIFGENAKSVAIYYNA